MAVPAIPTPESAKIPHNFKRAIAAAPDGAVSCIPRARRCTPAIARLDFVRLLFSNPAFADFCPRPWTVERLTPQSVGSASIMPRVHRLGCREVFREAMPARNHHGTKPSRHETRDLQSALSYFRQSALLRQQPLRHTRVQLHRFKQLLLRELFKRRVRHVNAPRTKQQRLAPV